MENEITEMSHSQPLEETLKQSSSRWTRSDIIVQVLVENTAKDPGFISLVVAFDGKHMINAVKEELKKEL